MRSNSGKGWRGGLGWLAIVVAAGAAGVLGFVAMQPDVVGQFHDDAIYLANAKSLVEGGGYRHASLPEPLVQTKYPPLHAVMLAGVWRLAPAFPESIPWFKSLSVVFLVASVFAAGVLGTRRLGGRWAPGFYAFLAGTCPLVFPFADYALTELPFLLLCLTAFVLAPDATGWRHGETGERTPIRRAVLLGIICGIAMLYRQAGLPLILAGLMCYALRRERKEALVFGLVAGAFFVPWLAFKLLYAPPQPNPLLAYYVGYEPSVLELGLANPALAVSVASSNLVYLWGAFDLTAMLHYFPALRIVLYPVLLIGVWQILSRPFDFLSVFAVLYCGLIVLWPWHPARYAIPLAPLVPLSLFLGVRWLGARLGSGTNESDDAWVVRARTGLAWVPVGLTLLMSGLWLESYVKEDPDTTRSAFYSRLDYRWEGFEQTASWIEENTAPTAILATAYDPLYYLYTGRRGIRPWEHRPWTYFYPVFRHQPELGSPEAIQVALDEVGATHFVIDPLDGYVEGEEVGDLYAELLGRYRGPEYDGLPALRFVSDDGLHRVYELPSRVRR